MRKKASFKIDDRITTFYQAQGELSDVFKTWGEYIASETLTTRLLAGTPPVGMYTEEHKIDGGTLILAVKQNAK